MHLRAGVSRCVYFERVRIGLGKAFKEWLYETLPAISFDRLEWLEGMIRALIEYSGADYPTVDVEDDETLARAFHRAWVDRFGWAYSVLERPAD